MDSIIKKYQQRFRKIRDEMEQWDQLQSRFISQFRNVSSIIQRLKVIQESKNYGSLSCVGGIEDAVLQKQMESLQTFFLSMKNTLNDFHVIVLSLEKICRDSKQLVKGGSSQPTMKQMQQRIGVKPSLQACVNGLMLLHEMHHSEYLLKLSLFSALSALTLKPSNSDLGALQQLLVDQPNIPKEEVQFIFDIIFAEEIQ
ncbi:hypothetical protein CFOL_v3_20168 [Cephalotus follicularis]|uniref:Casein Kinase 2 substrate n=1 Tax=Cephalotus follicularis TaxID=3775 RepID=A0A1Q3C8X8_CEPFO|nr:hypothetical protein CFOL_v3_20168 [Cephalotus follicularis]